MADAPETRLDRIARDLSRTWLHGSRVTDNAGHTKPATVATAQQIQVDLPASGPMNFQFQTAAGAQATVLISQMDARNSRDMMISALGADRAKYLTLEPDNTIPNWVFSQRMYSFPNPLPDEDKIIVPDPSAPGATLTIVQLPEAALGEVQAPAQSETDCFASLEQYDTSQKVWNTIDRSNWQPAIMLRFNLKQLPSSPDVPAGMQLFEIHGAPQGDRYYLDHLGLLDAYLSTVADPNPPEIEAISLAVQLTTKGTPTRVDDWTIVRTNLTREARSGSLSAAFRVAAGPATLPYVAIAGVNLDQDKDAIRLLQMISITNSGGYYLRVPTSATFDTLVLSILLKAKADPDPDTVNSTLLWRAANAAALKPNIKPDSIRFNGLAHVQIAPAVPPGNVAFGWKRTEPDIKTTDEDKFGYGTISLVDYIAIDGTGNQVGPYSQDTCIAISPSEQPKAKLHERQRLMAGGRTSAAQNLNTGSVAAMQLLPRHRSHLATASLRAAPGLSAHYYRSTLACYDPTTESPYSRIADPLRSQIAFTPGFRDVFGNHFDAAAAPLVRRRLFYTDALVPSSEWPGIRFAVYPGQQSGKPYLFLEMQYRFLGTPPSEEKDARIKRLKEIRAQLKGANADVAVTLIANPLSSNPFSLNPLDLTNAITDWIKQENDTTSPNPVPRVKGLAAIPCTGQVSDVLQFKPELIIARTKVDYLPSTTDLPTEAILAQTISSQISLASSPVSLQAGTANPLPAHSFAVGAAAPASRSDDEFRKIAEAFQDNLATALKMQAGFLRDSRNQHELWFVPNAFFPTSPSPATYAVWSFATARPLSNKLHSETFGVPDFTTTCSGSGPDCWKKHPIISQTWNNQDFDELGRTAFRLIEKESVGLGVITAKANADAARTLLSEREQIALTLARFQGDGGPSYLVPLYANTNPGDVEEAGIVRATQDAFLNNLGAFYDVDTVMQLPLASTGSNNILTFEGAVTASFGQQPAHPPPPPVVSNILLGGSDRKVTVLYDLPSGTTEPTAVQQLAALTANLHHIQLPLKRGASTGNNLFNQGLWLELIKPWPLQWKAPSDFIPVAGRKFPDAPMRPSTETVTSWTNLTTGAVSPPLINESNASLLVRWGWRFNFGLLDATSNDVVHVTTRYNEPSITSNSARPSLSAMTEWTPQSLLNSLVAIKLLQDNVDSVSEPDRLQITADLAGALRGYLAAPTRLMRLAAAPQPEDHFAIHAPPARGRTPNVPPDEDGGRSIMRGAINVSWTAPGSRPRVATVVALADSANNNAFLTGPNPVRNYRVSLKLLRNEKFGPGTKQPANPTLIYECAPVESTPECWAKNIWAKLQFDMTGQTLQSALRQFFQALLQLTNLSAIDIEVDATLPWTAGMLNGATSFSILPTDMKPGDASPDAIATFVYTKCQMLLGTGGVPPDVSPALRLRVKLATREGSNSRTLLDIEAIEFPL